MNDIVRPITRLNWYYCLIARSVSFASVGLGERVEEMGKSTKLQLLQEKGKSGLVACDNTFKALEDSSANVDALFLGEARSSDICSILLASTV